MVDDCAIGLTYDFEALTTGGGQEERHPQTGGVGSLSEKVKLKDASVALNGPLNTNTTFLSQLTSSPKQWLYGNP